MKYTKEQLTQIRDYLMEIKVKEEKIGEWLAFMFEEQYPPFISYYDPLKIIEIFDKDLHEALSYVFYECTIMEWWWGITLKDWTKHKISWNAKWFIKYVKVVLDN